MSRRKAEIIDDLRLIMEYKKIINLVDNTPNQPSKFKTKNLVGINDDSQGVHGNGSQIKFEISILRSSLCDYSDAYILAKGTIKVPNTAASGVAPNNKNKKVVLKNCTPFTDCTSEINNTEIDHVKHIDVVMPVYNLIEYSDNYSKTSGSLWQYYRDEPAINDNGVIIDFPDDTDSASLTSKQKLTGQTENDRTKDIQIMVLLKYLSKFRRTLEMH